MIIGTHTEGINQNRTRKSSIEKHKNIFLSENRGNFIMISPHERGKNLMEIILLYENLSC